MPHVPAFAFEDPLWILQAGAAEEAKLDVVRSRVDVGDRHVAYHPAAVAPLYRFLEPGATRFTNVRNVRIIERFLGDWSAKYSSKLPYRFIFIGFIGHLRRQVSSPELQKQCLSD